ncbi:MAG TPA: PIN domain-containing protein [Steroidobacteraceae bacterium]|nr:PIN domain-containing protein [Steroidobacteraceae bacterium]
MIFVVDTNTLSEPMKPEPNRKVLSLLTSRQFDWGTSATAWEEFTLGIRVLSTSARRNELEAYRRGLLNGGLEIVPFDAPAADWMASERARLLKKGATPAYRDAQIAAVAASRALVLVTRNVEDFKGFRGLKIQNWFA